MKVQRGSTRLVNYGNKAGNGVAPTIHEIIESTARQPRLQKARRIWLADEVTSVVWISMSDCKGSSPDDTTAKSLAWRTVDNPNRVLLSRMQG